MVYIQGQVGRFLDLGGNFMSDSGLVYPVLVVFSASGRGHGNEGFRISALFFFCVCVCVLLSCLAMFCVCMCVYVLAVCSSN